MLSPFLKLKIECSFRMENRIKSNIQWILENQMQT